MVSQLNYGDCIRSGYVGGQLVITRNISSFSFFTIKMSCTENKSPPKISSLTVVTVALTFYLAIAMPVPMVK